MTTNQDEVRELLEIIVNCRKGAMDDKQFKATVEHCFDTLLAKKRGADCKTPHNSV